MDRGVPAGVSGAISTGACGVHLLATLSSVIQELLKCYVIRNMVTRWCAFDSVVVEYCSGLMSARPFLLGEGRLRSS